MRLQVPAVALLASFMSFVTACGDDPSSGGSDAGAGQVAAGAGGRGGSSAGASGGVPAAGAGGSMATGGTDAGVAGAAAGAGGMAVNLDAGIDAAAGAGGAKADGSVDGPVGGAMADAGIDAAVNECAAAVSPCSSNATCTDTPAGYTCACNSGFSGNGVTCADVDECATANGGCSPDALCANTPGSRTCSCKAGFTGDGVTCTDVDECATNRGGCDPLVACNNTPGSHTCGNCPAGYEGGGAGGCVDKNECTAGTANCSANADCTNSDGSFACACKAGFTGNGLACATCSTCGAGEYQAAACTATTNTACATCAAGCTACTGAGNSCTACAPGLFLSNGACVACSACGAGQYKAGGCVGTTDTVCANCTTCGAGLYRTAACTATTDAVCATCTTCAAGQFRSSACTATRDATCSTCGTCGSGQWQMAACSMTSDTACSDCTACPSGQYQTAACTATANTACMACSTCGAGEYQTAACTATTNTSCMTCTTCGSGQYQMAACTATVNTVCATCATCPVGQYVSAACSAAMNTACSTCAANCTACTGLAACTTCAAGYALKDGGCVPVGTSCRALRVANAALPSGVYQLDPDGAGGVAAFFAYCDMTTDGGGWMKILQYHDAPYAPTAGAIGDIAVAGTAAIAKLADANVNSLAALTTAREYRIQGAISTKKLFIKSSVTWDDLARGHGLIATGTTSACESTTNCAYEMVSHYTIDSNDWSPSSIGGANNEDRYFTDYSAPIHCFATGDSTKRCYGAGNTVGHVLIPDLSIWVRELPLEAEPFLIYTLEENMGVAVNDVSGNGRHATVLAGGWTTGKSGSGLAGALRTNAAVPITNAVTVSVWVRRDGVGGLFVPRILSWERNGGGDGIELGDWGGGDELAVLVENVGWHNTGMSFGSGYHHIAVTVGGGTARLYFDGVEVFSTAGAVNLAGPMSIGTRWDNGESWNGGIDNVVVFDRALTAAEILRLAQP